MKKLIFTSLIALLTISAFASKTDDNIESLYKHLGRNIKYPAKASANGLQGNSLILFTVADGKIKDIQVNTQLGGDCDGEVVNRLLSFTDYKSINNGKYALKTRFKLDGLSSIMMNNLVKAPVGYTLLSLTVVGYYNVSKTTTSPSLNIRGTKNPENSNGSSLRGAIKTSSSPMYIVDGENLDSVKVSMIDPKSIESIDVFKGEKAIALYGKEAENGAIVIKSKNYVPKEIK